MDAEVLRQMLTERRAAVSPEGLGLVRMDPRGRKSPGLTQAHMDHLLLRAPGTYGKLERGVLDNPAPEYLRDVAHTLGLTEQEWVVLYGYARGEQPPFPLADSSRTTTPRHWREVITESPGVTYISDSLWNVHAYSRGFAGLFPGRRVPHNTMHWMLFDESARTTLLDWENRWGPVAVPQLRLAQVRHKGDPVLQWLTDRCLADPLLSRWYRSVPSGHAHPDGAMRPWRHPEHGPGTITMCVSELSGFPGLRQFQMMFRTDERTAPEYPESDPRTHDPAGYYPPCVPAP
ncbi:XRE family transcriptional regulator [Streptomyces sp. CA-181903]|uniref:MmyB family transcriptional regulator n=1 Tax=Streptomyces sp. CA-181903 TaxID=3240055 RepID=UPI003D8C033E